ncbi:MAG: 4Fe-4S binding protein [Methanosarcinaceae archaeon]|nr:4Fe-4S binding protein [Methanosarcinaceae archaeon]
MKQLTVISGKGGTGKTTLTAAFASLANNAVFADCDVDAADMHLILKPEVLETEDFCGLEGAVIDKDLCVECGKCREHCRYGAITEGAGTFKIDPLSCEGCAVCTLVCPEGAVSMQTRVSGQAFISRTRFGPMAHARLGIGEEASGKLVSEVRENAKKLAEKSGRELIIIDGPPGTGCPVIAAITGTDLILVVSEPTLSGLHDLKRVIELAKHFRIPAAVCINKYDINEENTRLIEDFCEGADIPVLGRLPYDDVATLAMLREESVIEYAEDNVLAGKLRLVWETLVTSFAGARP